MADRPSCIVEAHRVRGFDRESPDPPDGVGWCVRPVSDAAGLTQMGVKIREVQPGLAGTHLHYHDLEEEWTYVLSGRGRVRINPLSLEVRAGSFVAFPPGPRPHHFIAEGDAPLVCLEGGERRRAEDWRTYPDLGVRNCDGADDPIDAAALPPFEGEAGQLVHLGDLEERVRPHPLAPDAVRHQRGLDAATGLQRQACAWVRLEPGVESTTYHYHEGTDEWVYLLSGEAEARIGDERHRVSAGDFVAHPARGPAHVMRAVTEVTYLMGGEHSPDDVVIYPELGMQLSLAGFEKLAR